MAPSTKDFVPSDVFPEPTVVPPLKQPHYSTVMFLHGRGDSSSSFSYILRDPACRANLTLTLRNRLPHTSFIFPQTKLRRSTENGMVWNEWFDLMELKRPATREELQIVGLREAGGWVRELIEKEKDKGIPEGKIILCGISQGCATALHALLGYEGKLGGFVGFSGWFPFQKQVMDILEGTESYPEKRSKAVNMLRKLVFDLPEIKLHDDQVDTIPKDIGVEKILDAEGKVEVSDEKDESMTNAKVSKILQTPVFLGHGTLDDIVDIKLGEGMRDMCERFGMDVTWKKYNYIHWYQAPEQLEDVVDWIAEKGWEKGWELEIDDGEYEPREDDN